MLEKVKKNIFLSLALAAIIYLGFSLYADYTSVVSSFKSFNWVFFPIVLFLAYLNYVCRFLKWDYYLRILNVNISKRNSFDIFMSGLIMGVTPGKVGEVLKSFMVKQIDGTPVHKTAPIVLAERITDFLSLIFIAIIGAIVYGYGIIIVIIILVLLVFLIFALTNRKITESILLFLSKFSFLKKHIEKIKGAYDSSYILLSGEPLMKMFVLSLISWFFECMAFYVILKVFQLDAEPLWSAFIYSFSMIVGSVTMLPAGLGVTDGSLTFLLTSANIPIEIAVAATFIIRMATLWFSILVGVISVVIYQRRMGKIITT